MTPPLSTSWTPTHPTYSINKTQIYHVSKHSSSHYGSLIDRGANGGLAGSNVRILKRVGRTVSVTCIDNHELPGLDIVTCAALPNTNHGKVARIMHEYAYYGRGNTIHSPGQIEWFQNSCDDKSFHVGGKQVINFLDGYSTVGQVLIWTILNPVKPSPLMTPPLSTSWTPTPLLLCQQTPHLSCVSTLFFPLWVSY